MITVKYDRGDSYFLYETDSIKLVKTESETFKTIYLLDTGDIMFEIVCRYKDDARSNISIIVESELKHQLDIAMTSHYLSINDIYKLESADNGECDFSITPIDKKVYQTLKILI